MHCINCGQERTRRRGQPNAKTNPNRYRYSCNACGENFYTILGVVQESDEQIHDHHEDDVAIVDYGYEDSVDVDASEEVGTFIRDDAYINRIKSSKKIVITTAQNNAEVDQEFLTTLKSYCAYNGAELVIIPVRYRVPERDAPEISYAEELLPYLVDNNISFDDHRVVIMCGLKLLATAVNPLAQMDAFSKGNSLILGHSQLQLRTLARGKDRKYPPIITTTGAITKERYSTTKSGISADFNHSMSATVLELTDDEYFIRQLNFDSYTGSFCDLDTMYHGNRIMPVSASVCVTGDSHVVFHDPEVFKATYATGGLMDCVKPSYWVIHDLLDFFCKSHHSTGDQFVSYLKNIKHMDNVKNEIDQALGFVTQNKPSNCTAIVVGSNHDIHLDKWLKETDIRKDPVNAKLFHWLSYLMYKHMDMNDGQIPAALEVYYRHQRPESTDYDVKFLKEFDSFKLYGIELATHGHSGKNGQRGQLQQFTSMPDKTITGHSHSPAINKGSYCVGTSSIFHMGYVKSASTWDHAHCLIFPNGKRQLVFLRNGKFRA